MYKKIFLMLPLLCACTKASKEVSITKSVSLDKTEHLADSSEQFCIGEYPEKDWWIGFKDQHLTCLIERALQDNPSLSATKERVDAANNQALEVRSSLFPQIAGLFQYAWLYLADTHVLKSIIPTLRNNDYLYALLFNCNYQFDIFGLNKKKYEAALGEATAAKLMHEQAKIVLSTTLSKAYFSLVSMKAKKTVVQNIYQNRERLYSLVKLRRTNRMSSGIDENKVKESLSAYAQILSTIDAEIRLQESLINILAGESPETTVETAPCFEVLSKRLEFPEKITSTLLARRPDLLASLWTVKKNATNIGVAIRNFLPTVSLVEGPALVTGRGKELFHAESFANILTPLVSQPIFEGGRLWAGWKKSVSIYKDSVFTFNAQFLEAAKQVFDSVVNLQKIASIVESQGEKVQAAKKNYGLEYLKFSNGLSSMIQVLGFDDTFLQSKLEMIDKQNQKYSYYIDCIKAIGGGFESEEELPLE